jgi:proteasome lid subunit RPN8/RPN11
MEEQDYLEVLREAEAAGAMVTAVYHSHVEAGAYFSIDDQEFALHELYPFPRADHLVVSVVNRVVKDVAAFRRVPGAGCFEGRRLLVRTP